MSVRNLLWLDELPGQFTETGWQPERDVTFESWERGLGRLLHGEKLRREQLDTLRWALGDWINYGEKRYGEKYAQAIEGMHYEPGTLANIAWITRNIPRDQRKADVPFFSHAPVASVDDPVARQSVLDTAARDKLTRHEIAQEADAAKKNTGQTITNYDGEQTTTEVIPHDKETCPTCHGLGVVPKHENVPKLQYGDDVPEEGVAAVHINGKSYPAERGEDG